ncbi:MAG: single-stranded DNA-binding protein [Coriobacteriales bacterium]|jgi:spoIIIJ-associated protein|nr:single-stranded DNA-binding protein [Coriobacteriales bacterium]
MLEEEKMETEVDNNETDLVTPKDEAEEANSEQAPLRTDLDEEELDHVADVIIAKLREVLAYFDASDATIDEYEGDDGELILDVNGVADSLLIGKYGRNLAALQSYLIAASVKELGFRYPFTVDIEGYKSRIYQRLEQLALNTARKAKKVKGPVRMKPMRPADRRIIHRVLTDDPEVTTESEGEGMRRHVVVIYLGNDE